MNVIEKYARATTSSNLRDDHHNHQAEPLAAIALAGIGGIGPILWRVKYANDASSYHQLLRDWTEIVFKKAGCEGWPRDVSPRHISKMALDQFILDRCQACEGTGRAPHPGNAQVRSDDECPVCHGTARQPLSGFKNQINYIRQCVDVLLQHERDLARVMMIKLNGQFDL